MSYKKSYKKKHTSADESYWGRVYVLANASIAMERFGKAVVTGEIFDNIKLFGRKILHDGIMIDGYLFTREYKEFGVPNKPLVINTPVLWFTKAFNMLIGKESF